MEKKSESLLVFEDNNIALGQNYTMKISDNKNLYVWGDNYIGQLGIGTNENKRKPTKLKIQNTKPKSIYTSSRYSMAICEDGNLYAWGSNLNGELGLGNKINQEIPQLVNLPNGIKAKHVSLGLRHSMIIANDGNLYSCGENFYGQLGIGYSLNDQETFKLVKLPDEIKPKTISLGNFFSMMIGNDDNLYAWGSNNYGQLGLGNTLDQNFPQLVKLPNGVKVKSITTGSSHVMIIGSDDNLYSWGNNCYGQLGLGETILKTTPQLVKLPNEEKCDVVKVESNYSMIISKNGNLYSCGENHKGQLGQCEYFAYSKLFTLVKFPNQNKIKEIYLGNSHIIFKDFNNVAYACGSNKYGELLVKENINIAKPIEIKLP